MELTRNLKTQNPQPPSKIQKNLQLTTEQTTNPPKTLQLPPWTQRETGG